MTLVDTSVWVDHLRRGNKRLAEFLNAGHVLCHTFVVGEIACGWLKSRDHILGLLSALPQLPKADDDEILDFISRNGLMGAGLGLVDVHMLAAARMARVPLWTNDKALRAAAARMHVLCYPGG